MGTRLDVRAVGWHVAGESRATGEQRQMASKLFKLMLQYLINLTLLEVAEREY